MIEEIVPGLAQWSAFHEGIGHLVHSSFDIESGTLIDPMEPEEGLDAIGNLAEPRRIVLSNRHHYRHSDRYIQRFGCPVLCHTTGLAHFGDDRPVTGFSFDEQLTDGVRTLELGAICREETAVLLDVHNGALVFGDGLTRTQDGSLGFMPDSLLGEDPSRVRKGLLRSQRHARRGFRHAAVRPQRAAAERRPRPAQRLPLPPPRRARQLMSTHRLAQAATGTLSLTFDDGPDTHWTALVLDTLAENQAHGTFFVVGERLATAPAVAQAALEAGHELQLHCHRHVRHTELGESEIEHDTHTALRALAELGVHPTRWRTPWGVHTPATHRVAARHRLKLVHWTIDTHDWRGDSAAAMLARACTRLEHGGVVLMHDGLGPGARRGGCENTVELLAPLIAAATRAGLSVGPLSRQLPPLTAPESPSRKSQKPRRRH